MKKIKNILASIIDCLQLFMDFKIKPSGFVRVFIAMVFVGSVFSHTEISAQSWEHLQFSTENYFEMKRLVDEFFEENQHLKTQQGSGYKDYIRWTGFWDSRVDANGSFSTYKNAMQDFNRYHRNTYNSVPANWNSLGPSTTAQEDIDAWLGLVSEIWINPNDNSHLLAASNTGGLFKTNDAGMNWEPLTDELSTLGIQSIYVSPLDLDEIFIATGTNTMGKYYSQGIWKTNDGGKEWSETGFSSIAPTENYVIKKLLVNPITNNIMYAIYDVEFNKSAHVAKSTDKGETWSLIFSISNLQNKYDNQIFDIEFKPNDPNVIYIGGGNWVKKSINGGSTWTDITPAQELNRVITRTDIAVTPQNPSVIMIVCHTSDTLYPMNPNDKTKLFKSFNAGVSYNEISITIPQLGQVGYWKMEFEISPTDTNHVYIGGKHVYKYFISQSPPYEALYVNLPQPYHVDIRSMKIFNVQGQDHIYIGNDGGVTRSEDGGQTWIDMSKNGLAITQLWGMGIADASPVILCGPQDGNKSIYNSNTGEWIKRFGDAYDAIIDFKNPDNMYIASQEGQLFKYNYYTNNFSTFLNINQGELYNNNFAMAMHPVNTGILFIGMENIWQFHEGNFTRISDIIDETANKRYQIGSIKLSNSHPNIMYASRVGPQWSEDTDLRRIWKTTNNGIDWIDITPYHSNSTPPVNLLDGTGISDIAIHVENPDKVWVSLDRNRDGVKVLFSENGGVSWINYSEGIPNFPVNCIRYCNFTGMQGVVIGTDAGVYFRSQQMQEWERLGENMPLTIVTDIELYNDPPKIVAATFGRGVWEADFSHLLYEDIYITENTLWDYNQKFYSNIYINPGVTLTISSNIVMGKNKKIVVKRGGKLIVDEGHINSHNGPWQGIEVWGDPRKSQYPDVNGTLHQGQVIIRNGSVIEDALVAVIAGRLDIAFPDSGIPVTPIPVDGQYNGGIIYAHSSEFRNNKVSIYFPPYENFHPINMELKNNVSYIKNCNFLLNPAILSGLQPEAFIKLIGVRGISCQGNHYVNDGISVTSGFTGILSLNSSFSVNAYCLDEFLPCQNYRLSRFENLTYGIQALGAATAKTFTVDTTEFISNRLGIYTSDIDHFSVTRSFFSLLGVNPDSEKYGGIYVDGPATGFSIEENVLTGGYNPGIGGETAHFIGATFNNTGPTDNLVYRNWFEKCHVGTLALNHNRAVRNTTGLRFKCNEYTANQYDLVVNYDDQLYSWGGIAPEQGGPGSAANAPAGNRFTWADNPFTPHSDINNLGEHIYYYYHVNLWEKLRPEYVDTLKVTRVANYDAEWSLEESCPSNLTPPGGGHDEQALRGMMAEAELQADTTQTIINMLRDAGDTEALHWDVSMSAPWQGMEVYSGLMTVSPYVSDTVLAAAIEKENVLVDAMIRDVLVANPHSAKSGTLMEKLDQRLQPLPGYMLDEILQGQSLVSVYENLQASLSHHLQKHDLYKKQLVQLYLNDTIQPAAAADSLVSLLLASAHPAHWYRAAYLRHEQGNAVVTAAILNSIPSSFSLSAEQLLSHNQLVSWLEQENLLHNEDKSLAVPDSAAVVWLFNIMENGDLPVSIFAHNILLAHALVEHQPQYLLPDDTKSSKAKRPRSQSPPKEEALKLIPNPAREYVIVDFDLVNMKAIDGAGMLKVSGIDGKLIESLPLIKLKDQLVFPLDGYKRGTYVFTLYYGNNILESKRLIIR